MAQEKFAGMWVGWVGGWSLSFGLGPSGPDLEQTWPGPDLGPGLELNNNKA